MTKIYTVLPDEIRNSHPHGQWVFDQPGLVLNFDCESENHVADVEPWARKLEVFLKSDEPYMEFESPHVPGLIFLHRHAAEHIICTQPAWSQKVITRMRKDGGGTVILDNETGLPVISKFRN